MKLEEIREHIDRLDTALLLLLAERQSLMPYVAEEKRKKNLPIAHPKREQEIIKEKTELGKKYGLRKEYLEKIYRIIIEESKYIQENILKK